MRYLELRNRVKENIFTSLDVQKYFPNNSVQTITTQLYRFAKQNLIVQIKRELYCFEKDKVDELELAERLYQPSYISCESALNYYGIVPDIYQSVTNVTLITTKKINNDFGTYLYTKIKPELFFGFSKQQFSQGSHYAIAFPEKALLDYFYLRKINKIHDLRLDLKLINKKIYNKFLKHSPPWVQKIKI